MATHGRAGHKSAAMASLLTKAEKSRAAASAKAHKAEAARTRALDGAVHAAERDLQAAQRGAERAATELRNTEQQLVQDTHIYGLHKANKPLFDKLVADVAAARSVKDVLAALATAVATQEAAVAQATAACESEKSASNNNKAAQLSQAKQHAVMTLKMLKGVVKNPRKLPRPVALSAWYAGSRDVVERVRRAATAAGENARGAEQRYFTASVWPSPEFFDTRWAAEADYATDTATFYQQLAACSAQRVAGAKRKASDALAAPAECSCCMSEPAVFACSAPAGGHSNYCAECMLFLVDRTLRPEVAAGTRLLDGAAADADAAALHACCVAGCGSALRVGDTKARIIATLGGNKASLAEVLDQELLYGKLAELAARSAEMQLQRELNAKLGEQTDPTPAEVKAHIHELINVVKCPNCDTAYFGVTEACQHAYCTCRPTTAFCAYCFQNHSDYQNCVLYPRYSDDDVAPDDPEAPEAARPAVQDGANNTRRFNKLRASYVMKAHHINRVLASASSATIRAVLADPEVLTWLREIHVTVNTAACGAAVADVASCPLNIDGIGAYVSGNIRSAFQQTFEACRNKPYANDHALDTLMRRASEAERAAMRAAALCAELAVFDAPFTAADFEARLDQLRNALRNADTFPFRLPRSVAAARAAFAACTAGMDGEQRKAANAKLDELAERSVAAFAEYKDGREAARLRMLKRALNSHAETVREVRATNRERVKSAPQRLRRAQRHMDTAAAVKRAAERGVAAARAMRDSAAAGQGSAAALPAVAAAVAASNAATTLRRQAATEDEEPQEPRRFVFKFRLNGAVMETPPPATSPEVSDDSDDFDDDEDPFEDEDEPPRRRRRLWRPVATPEASSDEEEDDFDPPRRGRFMRCPATTPDADAATSGDEAPARRRDSPPAATPEPIVISSDDEF